MLDLSSSSDAPSNRASLLIQAVSSFLVSLATPRPFRIRTLQVYQVPTLQVFRFKPMQQKSTSEVLPHTTTT